MEREGTCAVARCWSVRVDCLYHSDYSTYALLASPGPASWGGASTDLLLGRIMAGS